MSYDDKAFLKALIRYVNDRNWDLEQGLEKRLISIVSNKDTGIIAISKKEAQPTKQTIAAKVASLGLRVKIRPSIRVKRLGAAVAIQKELKARQNAIGYTRFGWLLAGKKLRDPGSTLAGKFGNSVKAGVRRGGNRDTAFWIEAYNNQPAGELMNEKYNIVNRAIDADTADMTKWLNDKVQAKAEEFTKS